MTHRTDSELPTQLRLRLLREGLGWTRVKAGEVLGFSARQLARWESGEVAVRPAIITALEALRVRRNEGIPGFNFIDLFAGIGGFRLGFERASELSVKIANSRVYLTAP